LISLRERVSYLKGLAEGLALDTASREGKLLNQIVSILSDLAEEVDKLREAQQDLQEYVSALDESVGELEEDYYGGEGEDDEEEDDEEEGYIEVECPKCHEKVYFEEDMLDDDVVTEITCPQCGEVVFSTADEGEDEEGDEEAPSIPAED
jgi:ribosomal protein S27E